MRINGDGTADATFHAALYAVLSGGVAAFTTPDTVSLLAVQADGKIVVGGRFATVDGEWRLKLARLNDDGTLSGRDGGNLFPQFGVLLLVGRPDLLLRDFAQLFLGKSRLWSDVIVAHFNVFYAFIAAKASN